MSRTPADVRHFRECLSAFFSVWETEFQRAFDGFYVYQTGVFMQSCPNSPTAAFFRWLFLEDVKGVLCAFYRQTRTVYLTPISEKKVASFQAFEGATEDQIRTIVSPIGAGSPPAGMLTMFGENLNGCSRLGAFYRDLDAIVSQKNNLLDQHKKMLDAANFSGPDSFAPPEVMSAFCERLLAVGTQRSSALFRDAAKLAVAHYSRLAGLLDKYLQTKKALNGDRPRPVQFDAIESAAAQDAHTAPGMLKEADRLETVSKAGGKRQIKRFTDAQLHALLGNSSGPAEYALAQTDSEDILSAEGGIGSAIQVSLQASQFNLNLSGEAAASGAQGSRILAIAARACAHSQGMAASVGRMIVCANNEVAAEVEDALNRVRQVHERSLFEVRSGRTLDELARSVQAHRQASREQCAEAHEAGTISFTIEYYNADMGGVAGALGGRGLTIDGKGVAEVFQGGKIGASEASRGLRIIPGSSDVVLQEQTPILIRTIARVVLEARQLSFDVFYEDSLLPLADKVPTSSFEENPRQIIPVTVTHPDHLRASPKPQLRDFYWIQRIAGQPDVVELPTEDEAPRAQGDASEDSSSGSQSSSESEENEEDVVAQIRKRRAEQRAKMQNLEEHQRELGRQLQQRLVERFRGGRQKFRKDADATPIPRSYESVEEYPESLPTDETGVVIMRKSKQIFLFIAGHAVPFHPAMVHSVKQAGVVGDKARIRIQFVAPGVVTGKKREEYDQLDLYQDSFFIKEVVLECRESTADQVVQELSQSLVDARAANSRPENHIRGELDIDNRMDPDFRSFLMAREEFHVLPTTHISYMDLSRDRITQPLHMKPQLVKSKTPEGGSLQIHENGLRYVLRTAGGSVIFDIPYKTIKCLYYDKLRGTSNNAYIYVTFRLLTTPKSLISNYSKLSNTVSSTLDEAMLNKPQEGFLFYACFETGMSLAVYSTERDEIEQEKLFAKHMKMANKYITTFMDKLQDTKHDYEKAMSLERDTLFKVSTRARDSVVFEGSVSGNQTFYVYKNGSICSLSTRIQFAVFLADVDLVVFENVHLRMRVPFHLTFIFKDLRMPHKTINSVGFSSMSDLQEYFDSKDIKYYVTSLTMKWPDLYARAFKDASTYSDFLEEGGWAGVFEEDDDEDSSETSEEGSAFVVSESAASDSESEDEESSEFVASEEDEGDRDSKYDSQIYDFSKEESESEEQRRRRRR